MKGTVIKRGSTYSVVLDLGRGPHGRRVRKWHSGYRTKKDAERARVELLARLDQGAYVEPSNLTVAAFLRDHWLPGLRAQVRPGTWAEHLIAPAEAVIRIPDALSDCVAAQTLVNPMTAWAILSDELTLAEGDWVLQTAAGSTLGRLIIQLARRRALRTVNVVRRRAQVQELVDLGADAVICTEDESLVDRVRDITSGAGVRAAIDAVGGPQGAHVATCLAEGGTLLLMGLLSGAPLGPIDAADMIFRGRTVQGFWLITWFGTRPREAIERAFGEVISLLATGVLVPPVEAEYDLADFREAIAHAQRPGRRGKVLLRG